LHEVPLIANLIGRKKLYEMNKVISDTAEYGCYLFSHECVPLLEDFMKKIDIDVIGQGLQLMDQGVDNAELIAVNESIRSHPVEIVGKKLRSYMTAMKKVI
jgi:ketol-acid reductoisomerase